LVEDGDPDRMTKKSPVFDEIPINIVGSSKFGRYPKISSEKTYNMIISDGWLVPLSGYTAIKELIQNGLGRGIYNSNRFRHIVLVVDNGIFIVDSNLLIVQIATMDSYIGDVTIAENNANQLAICDQTNIYIFNYNTSVFQKITTDFTPGYIEFQNGYFIASESNQPKWRLSALNDGTNWPAAPQNVGEFETKPDNVKACVAFPGKSNLLMVMGENVSQLWLNVGSILFPYQLNTNFNIDYGCISAATIAKSDQFIAWLGSNEKSGLAIMYSSGGDVKQISTDGINFLLARITNPKVAFGFFYKQDGHLLYQVTFPDADDNLTLIYDFNNGQFFHLCDENMDFHIARKTVFFNGDYYFLGTNDGTFYKMSSDIYTFNGNEIPRIRVCENIRLPDASPFIANNLSVTLEQGEESDIARIDLSISRDGGVNFGSSYGIDLNSSGYRQNKLVYCGLGYGNDMVLQYRFWGQGRFVVNNAILSIYQ
jgi:hypothetical protein